MVRLSYVSLLIGAVLSFHDTLWPWTLAFVAGWAALATLEWHFGKQNFF